MSTAPHRLLWAVTPPKSEAISYLFGTMHVRDQRAFGGLEAILEHLEFCDAFAVEFDFAESDHHQLFEAAQLPEGHCLSKGLSASTYQRLEGVVKRELGQSLMPFEHLSPLLLINHLSEAQLQKEQHVALDHYLYEYAQQRDKILLGLETFEEQLAVFRALNFKEQCRALKGIATNFSRFRKGLQSTTTAYVKGDIQQLLHKTQRSIGSMRRILLYERNQRMAERFADYSRQHTLFAAVGAAHLAGEKGVLRLLKHRGFTLSPVAYR